MSHNRYYNQKRNKTPDQRRLYRKAVESAPVSATTESQDILNYDSTDKSLSEVDESYIEPIENRPIAYGFQWTIKSVWQVVIGAFIFLSVIIGIIAYVSDINSKISVNETKLNVIEDDIQAQEEKIENNKNEIIEYIDKQIKNFKEDFKNFYFKE
jgi:hypothetical protein